MISRILKMEKIENQEIRCKEMGEQEIEDHRRMIGWIIESMSRRYPKEGSYQGLMYSRTERSK